MSFQPVDRLPRIEWATWWDKTLERWQSEGLPAEAEPSACFGLDPYRQWWFNPRAETFPQAKAGLRPFETPFFHRPLAWWLNTLIDAGLTLERVGEPVAADETARACPAVRDTRLAPYFLHIRCRKGR